MRTGEIEALSKASHSRLAGVHRVHPEYNRWSRHPGCCRSIRCVPTRGSSGFGGRAVCLFVGANYGLLTWVCVRRERRANGTTRARLVAGHLSRERTLSGLWAPAALFVLRLRTDVIRCRQALPGIVRCADNPSGLIGRWYANPMACRPAAAVLRAGYRERRSCQPGSIAAILVC